MIDESEDLMTIAQAAKTIPNRAGGRGVNKSTVWRWLLRGVHGVRLETALRGGVRFTSKQALQRFFAASTAAADSVPLDLCPVFQQRRAHEAAERELAAAGL